MELSVLAKRILAFCFYLLCGGILFSVLLLGMSTYYSVHLYWFLLLSISCFGTLSLGTYFLCSSIERMREKSRCAMIAYRITFSIYLLFMLLLLFVFNDSKVIFLYSDSWFRYLKKSSNIIPFKTIYQYCLGLYNRTIDVFNFNRHIVGNIVTFMPFGLFLPCIFQRYKKTHNFIIVILLFRCVIELLQVIIKAGIFDIDDILLSLVGAYLMYRLFFSDTYQALIKKLYLVQS